MDKDFIINARSPLRLGLAGGGTDIHSYCKKYGGYALNATIDKYVYASIRFEESNLLIFESIDLNIKYESNTKKIDFSQNQLVIHQAVYEYFIKEFNSGENLPIRISSFCDAPKGSGLGTSSTLTVSLIKVFTNLFDISLDDYQLAKLAYKIERIDCKLEGGSQDQYAASFGGLNFMEFHKNGEIIVKPLKVKRSTLLELESSFLLYFTGISRSSDLIIKDQSNNFDNHAKKSLEAMHGIKKEALNMKDNIQKNDFIGIVRSLRKTWEYKKLTSSSVTNTFINNIFSNAIEAGALGGKISGAGGGGFMLLYVPLNNRFNVIKKLKQFGGDCMNCHFVNEGSISWRKKQ